MLDTAIDRKHRYGFLEQARENFAHENDPLLRRELNESSKRANICFVFLKKGRPPWSEKTRTSTKRNFYMFCDKCTLLHVSRRPGEYKRKDILTCDASDLLENENTILY